MAIVSNVAMFAHATDHLAPVELTDVTDLVPLSATTMGPTPRAAYDALRARWGTIAPIEIEPGVPAWLVMGYDLFCGIARNEELFARDPRKWRLVAEDLLPPGAAIRAYSPPQPRGSSYHHDGATRRRLRAPLDDALADLPLREVVASTDEICLRVIAGFGQEGTADLVGDYAARVGFLSMVAMFGFDHETAKQLMADTVVISDHRPGSVEARQHLGATLMQHVRQRKRDYELGTTGQNDLTSSFVRHPNFEDDMEIVDSIAIPLHAASMFLGAWISRTLHLQLADPAFAARQAGGRLALDDALEEVLWRDTPVPNSCLPRYATQDMELDGKLIRKGDALILSMAAVNQDPRVHTGDPWDEVGNRSHLAWGTGLHACPAPNQARLITRTAVQRLQRELDVRLAQPNDDIQWVDSPWTRHPKEIPVRYRRVVPAGTSSAPVTG